MFSGQERSTQSWVEVGMGVWVWVITLNKRPNLLLNDVNEVETHSTAR